MGLQIKRYETRYSVVVMMTGILACTLATGSLAQAEGELAKQTQNPVADLISIPFQKNTNFGFEPNHRTQNVLNIQPVIPLNLNENWNLITRTLLPIIKQPDLRTTSDDTWGLGDINISLFLSPAKNEGLIWGMGLPLSNRHG